MSLGIQIDKVTAVLLADGWHDVRDQSFEIDAYEFLRGKEIRRQVSGISSTGATWLGTDDRQVYCPLENVIAVKY